MSLRTVSIFIGIFFYMGFFAGDSINTKSDLIANFGILVPLFLVATLIGSACVDLTNKEKRKDDK